MRRARSRRLPLDLGGLTGRDELFRVAGGRRDDPAVDRWLMKGPLPLRSIAHRWFERMRQCGDDVVELLHDGCPVACVADAPFGYVNLFRDHVNVGFFQGAALADPAGMLTGTGKRMRHVKLRPGDEPSAAALDELVEAAYRDIRGRLSQERASA